jgi:hypothetical protein
MSKVVVFKLPIPLPLFTRVYVLLIALYYKVLIDFHALILANQVDFFGNGWYDRNRKTENFVEYWRTSTYALDRRILCFYFNLMRGVLPNDEIYRDCS